MVRFSKRFPERYFDVGIAEQHAVTFAAGMACEGLKPVVAIYSTFLQRAYDQLIHDVALQNLPVRVRDRPRAASSAPTARRTPGSYDIAYLRCIPNMIVMAPADENECRQMLYTGFQHDQARPRCAIRAARAPASAVEAGADSAADRQGRSARREGTQRSRSSRSARMVAPALARRRGARRDASPTCASSSRSTSSWCSELAATARRARDGRRRRRHGRRRCGVLEALLAGRHDQAGAATRPARRVHRARRSGQAALRASGWTPRASRQSIRERFWPTATAPRR